MIINEETGDRWEAEALEPRYLPKRRVRNRPRPNSRKERRARHGVERGTDCAEGEARATPGA